MTSGPSGAPESGLSALSRGLSERKGWLPGPTTGLEPGQEPGPGGGLDGHRGASGGGKVQNRRWESSCSVGRREEQPGCCRVRGWRMQGGLPSLALGLRWQGLGQAGCCLHAGPQGYLSAPGVGSEAAGTVRLPTSAAPFHILHMGNPGGQARLRTQKAGSRVLASPPSSRHRPPGRLTFHLHGPSSSWDLGEETACCPTRPCDMDRQAPGPWAGRVPGPGSQFLHL